MILVFGLVVACLSWGIEQLLARWQSRWAVRGAQGRAGQ